MPRRNSMRNVKQANFGQIFCAVNLNGLLIYGLDSRISIQFFFCILPWLCLVVFSYNFLFCWKNYKGVRKLNHFRIWRHISCPFFLNFVLLVVGVFWRFTLIKFVDKFLFILQYFAFNDDNFENDFHMEEINFYIFSTVCWKVS